MNHRPTMRAASNPTDDDLRAWAYGPSTDTPIQDWDLVLSWGVDRGRLRHCVGYADDPSCPNASFFLELLYQWVKTVGRSPTFDVMRPADDEWLDVARGVTDPAVKRWRHLARLVFQGADPFGRERWRAAREASWGLSGG